MLRSRVAGKGVWRMAVRVRDKSVLMSTCGWEAGLGRPGEDLGPAGSPKCFWCLQRNNASNVGAFLLEPRSWAVGSVPGCGMTAGRQVSRREGSAQLWLSDSRPREEGFWLRRGLRDKSQAAGFPGTWALKARSEWPFLSGWGAAGRLPASEEEERREESDGACRARERRAPGAAP